MIIILENGILPKHMDMACISGLMLIDMKGSGKWAWSMDWAVMIFVMEINIRDRMLKESLMERVSINGLLGKYILVIFWRGKNMEKENGGVIKQILIIQIFMRVNTKMTWNKVKELSHGLVVMFTKVNFFKMNVMAMEKCFGLKVVNTQVNGRKESSMVLAKWFIQMAHSRKVILKIMFLKWLLKKRNIWTIWIIFYKEPLTLILDQLMQVQFSKMLPMGKFRSNLI